MTRTRLLEPVGFDPFGSAAAATASAHTEIHTGVRPDAQSLKRGV
ncbi:MAG: hypothetical protein ACI9IV_000179 [Paracoccaceae bacterium]|jgi:hypothetical protein